MLWPLNVGRMMFMFSCWLFISYKFLMRNIWGWHPSFWYAVFRCFLDGKQYAKGQYAVCKNLVISYADNKFYFQKVQFSSRNKLNEVKNIISWGFAYHCARTSSFRGLNMNLGNRNTEKYRANTTKLTLTRMILHVHATDCIFKFFI